MRCNDVCKQYAALKAEVQRLQAEGKLDSWPTREQSIDWAYGNAGIENPDITREVVERAYERRTAP